MRKTELDVPFYLHPTETMPAVTTSYYEDDTRVFLDIVSWYNRNVIHLHERRLTCPTTRYCKFGWTPS